MVLEMGKIKSTERVVTKERDQYEDDNAQHTILFTAGTAILMACLKRAMITFLLQQWRAWVFLVLNLVLLAILFMSIRSPTKENQEINDSVEILKTESKKKRRQCSTRSAQVDEERKDCGRNNMYSREENGGGNEAERVDEDDAAAEVSRLSKDELNERVETFIAMFRQHLATDAKKCRTQFFDKPAERAQIFNFQKV